MLGTLKSIRSSFFLASQQSAAGGGGDELICSCLSSGMCRFGFQTVLDSVEVTLSFLQLCGLSVLLLWTWEAQSERPSGKWEGRWRCFQKQKQSVLDWSEDLSSPSSCLQQRPTWGRESGWTPIVDA